MGAEVLFYGGFLDGDNTRDPASADYVAGQPCEITSAGVKLNTADANFFGIFKNSKSEDDASGPQAADTIPTSPAVLGLDCGVIIGQNKVLMTPGVRADGTTDIPFNFPGAGPGWAVGDELFDDGSAKWDNAGGGAARGRVVKIPASATDDLIAVMYG